MKPAQKKSVITFAITFVAALSVGIFLRLAVFGLYLVPSESMENTLQVGDRFVASGPLVNALSDDIKRGDIVVFYNDLNWGDGKEQMPIYVKRVIALPGDHIAGDYDGTIWLNGNKLSEPYLKEQPGTLKNRVAFDLTIPEGRLWVMGDNRDSSGDSRYYQDQEYQGTISQESVIGKSLLKVYPFNEIETLK